MNGSVFILTSERASERAARERERESDYYANLEKSKKMASLPNFIDAIAQHQRCAKFYKLELTSVNTMPHPL